MNHDIIAIGASAGGIEVLLDLVRDLPADFPASIFVAMHFAPDYRSVLPELLAQHGPLAARHPLHGEPIERGHIYVAPPDNHLYLRPGAIDVVRGPKENGHRPSVDALFRSAAVAYGPRVVGVVLSGYRDCGTAGMMSIRARGGISVVQDPKTAAAREMPGSVLDHVPVDHVVSPSELAPLLVRLAGAPALAATEPGVEIQRMEGGEQAPEPGLVCPACSGLLTSAEMGGFEHFRCHVGHTFSLRTLVAEQAEALERALWAAVRTLEESATLSARLARNHGGSFARTFGEKERTQRSHAELIRKMLLREPVLAAGDAAKA